MTDLIRVHTLLSGIKGGRCPESTNKTRLLDIFSMIIDPMIRHFDLCNVALLASSCRSLRVLTSDERLLFFILHLLPSKNAQDTRRRFLTPRKIKLENVALHRYSQQHAFVHAMTTYSGLEGFRRAVTKRRESTNRRRERERQLIAYQCNLRQRRRKLVTDAIHVVGLPLTFWDVHVHTIRFVYDLHTFTPANEELHLNRLIEGICWSHYLDAHTDFKDRVRQRRDMMGYYPGLARDIEAEFDRPVVWPWLE
jgi:hypothetical protein